MGESEKHDIDFEIQFYEGILGKSPDFIQALIALGDLYTKAGYYQKGLDIDQRLACLRPDDPYVLYNLSCSYSLLGHVDKSFAVMQEAVGCGYRDFKFLEKDKDLENLRCDQRFQKYFLTLKSKNDAAGNVGRE